MALYQRYGAETLTAYKMNETSLPVVATTADITLPYTGQIVFATSDGRLWRYTGTAWAVFTGGPTWALYRATGQTITNNTWTSINFTNEDTDTGSVHDNSTNPDRVTVTQPGLYAIGGKAGFVANATGQRAVRLTKNGTVINGSSVIFNNVGASNVASSGTPTCYVQCALNDILRVQTWQQSGGNLDTASGTVGTDSAGDFPLFTGTWLRD